ncbi:cytochrome-c oxidase, cbb3-type subunit III [Maritimibacter dapengensis]|uniref:Cbb3-type cytochrome c oxidase subunit n=1 Tax=Maritimibacter dapengensis TaxID=2836868 RepID=A0ABS6SXA4_9RHOB|nr:cytochrome-c oxidase, cbb3-type subunit III [Maritimibacter dapengensis]MBV7377534.1 cytochrome-c oxidase, cbb3-type subunit III [Maritimibacter dapengensis]
MSDKKQEVETTGHVWDEDLKEFNNPLPRWWLWTFYATIIWGIGYTIAYPAWPLVERATGGLLGYSTRLEVAEEINRFEDMNAEVRAELASLDAADIPNNEAAYSYAIQSGRATFATYCSQCHGSGANGIEEGNGYPNLLDDDWLWGGDLASIVTTVTHGIRNEDDPDARYSEMPAFGDDYLEDAEITDVVAYVGSLSGQSFDGDVAAGETVFADNCSSCHMEDGSGDREQGAPNLTDAIWLYGGSQEQIESSVRVGPYGVMPNWNTRLDDAEIKAVAAYVHQLGGGE